MYMYIYIPIHVHTIHTMTFGRGDYTVGNPHRAQTYQFELFELKFLNSRFSSLSSY